MTKIKKDVVLSVRVRSVDLARLLIQARENGWQPEAASHLVQACVELVASQIAVEVSVEDARGMLREAFGDVGTHRNRKVAFENLIREVVSSDLDACRDEEIEEAVKSALRRTK